MDTRARVRQVITAASIDKYEDMDSLDTLDLCLAIEKEFGILIPDSDLEKLTSEDGLVELLDALKSRV